MRSPTVERHLLLHGWSSALSTQLPIHPGGTEKIDSYNNVRTVLSRIRTTAGGALIAQKET